MNGRFDLGSGRIQLKGSACRVEICIDNPVFNDGSLFVTLASKEGEWGNKDLSLFAFIDAVVQTEKLKRASLFLFQDSLHP